MNWRKIIWLAGACIFSIPFSAQQPHSGLTYRIETSGNLSNGTYAPLWLTANRYGLSSQKPNSGYVRAGLLYDKGLKRHWHIQAGIDLAGTANQTADFVIQQAFADISWKFLRLSVGSKERNGFPLDKNTRLSSGMMVEGPKPSPASPDRHPRIRHHSRNREMAGGKRAHCIRSLYRLELARKLRIARKQMGTPRIVP